MFYVVPFRGPRRSRGEKNRALWCWDWLTALGLRDDGGDWTGENVSRQSHIFYGLLIDIRRNGNHVRIMLTWGELITVNTLHIIACIALGPVDGRGIDLKLGGDR